MQTKLSPPVQWHAKQVEQERNETARRLAFLAHHAEQRIRELQRMVAASTPQAFTDYE